MGVGVRAAVTLLKAAADAVLNVEVETGIGILSKPHRGRAGGSEPSAWSGKLREVGANTSSYHRKRCLGHVSDLRVCQVMSCHVIGKGEKSGQRTTSSLEKSLSLAGAR